jgi:hypothetical protein
LQQAYTKDATSVGMYRTKEELIQKLTAATDQYQQQGQHEQQQQGDASTGSVDNTMSAYEFQSKLAQLMIKQQQQHNGMLCSIQVNCER